MSQEREQLIHAFAQRLTQLLKEKGLGSARAASGVRLAELAQIADCSIQMARKYALGLALPDYPVMQKIAHWLGVTPGWLAFGDISELPAYYFLPDFIHIDKKDVEYILTAIFTIFLEQTHNKQLVRFISDVMCDVSHLKANGTTIKKVIDLAVSSAALFKNPQEASETKHDE